jgi:hypothetical protein
MTHPRSAQKVCSLRMMSWKLDGIVFSDQFSVRWMLVE